MITVRKRPCPSCPYRRDVPSGIWEASEYDKLPGYDGDIMAQALAQATGIFLCHQRTGDLCAGWAGCHDMNDNLAVRLSPEDIDPAVFEYVSPVPLFTSGAEAAEHGKRDISRPGSAAIAKMGKLRRARAARADQEADPSGGRREGAEHG